MSQTSCGGAGDKKARGQRKAAVGGRGIRLPARGLLFIRHCVQLLSAGIFGQGREERHTRQAWKGGQEEGVRAMRRIPRICVVSDPPAAVHRGGGICIGKTFTLL